MSCQDGHLDDFPWVEFIHGGVPCRGTLRLVEFGAGGRAGDVQLSCDECGRRRRLSQAFGEEAAPFLPPRCRGRHPHLGITEVLQERQASRDADPRREQRMVSRAELRAVDSVAGRRARPGHRRGLVDPRRPPPGRDFLEFTLKSNPI